MNIYLIRPPLLSPQGIHQGGGVIPHIGLAYISSALKSAGYDSKVIDGLGESLHTTHELDFNEKKVSYLGLSLDQVVERIEGSPDIVGISCMFSYEWHLYHALIKKIKAKFSEVKIVLGGEHVTADFSSSIKTAPEVDVCVLGEGEQTIVEVVKAFENKTSLSEVKGIAFNKQGRVVKTLPQKRIQSINDIPRPDWESFPVEAYLDYGHSMTTIKHRSIPILMSRGCPYSCTFCSSPQMWGNDLYLREPEDVIDEISYYKEKYEIEHVDFVDLVGMFNRKWVKEFFSKLIKADLNISWVYGAGTRSEIIDSEMLKLYKDSNVLRLFYAPETGSEETVKKIKKRVDLTKIVESIKIANKLGISTRAPLIVGFPGQTLKEVFQSLKFGCKLAYLGVDDVVIHSYCAYPGSEIYRDLVSSGQLDVERLIREGKYSEFLYNEALVTRITGHVSWSEHIPGWSIPLIQHGGMLSFYLISMFFHPSKVFRIFKSVFIKSKPMTSLESFLYSRYNKISKRLKVFGKNVS